MSDVDIPQRSEKKTSKPTAEQPKSTQAASIVTKPKSVPQVNPAPTVSKTPTITPKPSSPTPKSSPTQDATLSEDVIYALVIDDEPANRDFLERLLSQTKMQVKGASLPKTALEIVDTLGDKIKLVMLDRQLPGINGVELLKQLREKLPTSKIVMATMHDDRAMIEEAFAAGCDTFLVKPNGFMELFHMIKGVCEDSSCLNKLDKLVFDHHGSRTWRT